MKWPFRIRIRICRHKGNDKISRRYFGILQRRSKKHSSNIL